MNNHKDVVISFLTGHGITGEIPSDFVMEVFIELCNNTKPDEIAEKLGISTEDVIQALNFWVCNFITDEQYKLIDDGYKFSSLDELKKAKEERLTFEAFCSKNQKG